MPSEKRLLSKNGSRRRLSRLKEPGDRSMSAAYSVPKGNSVRNRCARTEAENRILSTDRIISVQRNRDRIRVA